MELTSTTTAHDLVINVLTKDIYNELCSQGAIQNEELYLIDDDNGFDAEERPVYNIPDPISSHDAVNKDYVDKLSAVYQPKGNYLTSHQSLSDYYTKSQTNALSTSFRDGLATTASLTAYETKADLTANYYKKSQVSSAAEVNSALAGKQPSGDYATKDYAATVGPVTSVNGKTGTVSVYVPTKLSEFTNNTNFISSVPSSYKTYSDTKTSLSDDGYAVKSDLTKINLDGTETSVLNVVHMARSEYAAKVKADDGSILSNTIYILSADDVNAYGQKITNVAEPTLSGDAATKNYVDSAIADIPGLSKATSTALGGIKIGYSSANHNYAVQLDSNDKAYVNVPWTDVAISSARYDSATKQIILVFNDTTKTALSVNVADLVDTYTAGEGLKLENNKFSVSADYAKVSQLTAYETKADLTANYYKKSDLSSASQVNAALSQKQPVGNYISSISAGYGLSANGNTVGLSVFNTSISVDGQYVPEFMARHVSMSEYAQILREGALSNTLYVVSSETNDMMGERIMNVADPIELSDAVNKKYVDERSPAGAYLPLSGGTVTGRTNFTGRVNFKSNTSQKIYNYFDPSDGYFSHVGEDAGSVYSDKAYIYLSDGASTTYETETSAIFEAGSVLKTYDYSQIKSTSANTDLRQELNSISSTAKSYVDGNFQKMYGLTSVVPSADPDLGCLTCTVGNFMITTIRAESNETIQITLPSRVDGFARDFIVRFDFSDYCPTVQIVADYIGSSRESVTYETDMDDWIELEQGINIVSFTEVFRSEAGCSYMTSKKVIA